MPKLSPNNLTTLPQGKYQDHVVKHLRLVVGSIRRTWFIRTYNTGKEQWTRLGYVPGLTLGEAREAARTALGRIEEGLVAVAEEVRPLADKGPSIESIINDYEKAKRKSGKGVKSLDEALRVVRFNLGKNLKTPIRSFTKKDMAMVRDAIAQRGAEQMSDRFLSYVAPIWKWAAKSDKCGDDFVDFVPSLLRVGPGLVKRKRVLSNEEMARIWHACGTFEHEVAQAYGRLIRFLMCLGLRKEEAAGLELGRIIDGKWKLTAEETKQARPHLVQLPTLALQQLSRANDPTALAFAGRAGGGQIGGWSKLKSALDEASGVTGWRLHDLRRSVATGMQELVNSDGDPLISRDVISAILAHAVPGADSHYMHATMERAKARAWQLWADHLAQIIADKRYAVTAK